MAYVRTLVGRHGLRVHRLDCRQCRAAVYRFERFCPGCGAPNQNFEAEIFKRFARCTIDEAAQACLRWPDHVMEVIDDPMVTKPGATAYCTICGIRLSPTE